MVQRVGFAVSSTILWTLATIAVSLRYYVRVFMIRAHGIDDYLLLVTYLFYTGLASVIMADFVLMNSVQPPDLALLENISAIGGLTISSSLLYRLCQVFLKLSLAAFFLRITTEHWQRRTIYISVGLYSLFQIAYAFVMLFQCGIPYSTMLFFRGDSCLPNHSLEPLAYFSAASNCITDWIMVATPLIVIRTLHVSRKEKASVLALVSLGVLGSVVSVVRIPWVTSVYDPGDHATALAICSLVESGVGIIAASGAALRPLFAKVLEKTHRETTHKSSQYGHDSTGQRGGKSVPTFIRVSDLQQLDHIDMSPEEKALSRHETLFDDGSKAGSA